MFSALKLADGWLSAHDVMSLELSGSLVVLSACETGRQERHRLVAEPVGLARSFLAVGARAVIVSLWKADDAVTAELMSDFYRQPDRSRTPAAALQRAQQVVAHKHPHPAAWASFAIYGGLARKGNH
jgi:CHAT domain-containing protein